MNKPLLLAAVSSLFLAVGVWRLALRRPGYSHVRHTISELGESGAAASMLVAHGLFLPFGLAMLGVGWLSHALSPASATLAVCLGVGYVGAAVFPCDSGSPLVGSWRQSLHNLAGGVQYVGGAAAIWRLGALHWVFAVVALAVGACAMLLSVRAVSPWRGAIQRVAELMLLGSLVAALCAPRVA